MYNISLDCLKCDNIQDDNKKLYLIKYGNQIQIEKINDISFLFVPENIQEIAIIKNQILFTFKDYIIIHYAKEISKTYKYQLSKLKSFHFTNQFAAINQLTGNIQIFSLQHHFLHYPYDLNKHQYILIFVDWMILKQNQISYKCSKLNFEGKKPTIEQHTDVSAFNHNDFVELMLPDENLNLQNIVNINSFDSNIKIDILKTEQTNICNINLNFFEPPFIFFTIVNELYYATNKVKEFIEIIKCKDFRNWKFDIPIQIEFTEGSFANQQDSLCIVSNSSLIIFQEYENDLKKSIISLDQPIKKIEDMQYKKLYFITFQDQSISWIKIDILSYAITKIDLRDSLNNNIAKNQRLYLLLKIDNYIQIISQEFIHIIEFSERTIISNSKNFYRQTVAFISAHNYHNQLMAHIWLESQLINIELDLLNFTLKRPLAFTNMKNYIAIAVEQNEQLFTLIYKVKSDSIIILLEAIKISNINFSFVTNFFIYYNSQQQQKVKSIHKQWLNLTNLNVQKLVQNIKISGQYLNIINSNNQPFSINIYIYNQNYQLYRRETTQSKLFIMPQNFQIQDIVIGNIDNVEILSQENQQQLKYVQQQQILGECNAYYNFICFKNDTQNNIKGIISYKITFFLDKLKINQTVNLELSSDSILLYSFIAQSDKLMLVIIDKNQLPLLQEYKIQNLKLIYLSNKIVTELQIDQNVLINNQFMQHKNQEYQIIRFITNSQIQTSNIFLLYNQKETLKSQQIAYHLQGDYIIVQVFEQNFKQILNFQIKCSDIESIFSIQYIQDDYQIYDINLVLLDWNFQIHPIDEFKIEFLLYFSKVFVSGIIKVVYIHESQQLQLTKVKLLRHPPNTSNIALYYIDINTIVLKFQDDYYFYDLKYNSDFFDSICHKKGAFTLQLLNNSHYILNNISTQTISIVTLGYFFQLNDYNSQQDTEIQLLLENQVSKMQISLNLKAHSNYFILIIIIDFIIILIMSSYLKNNSKKIIKQHLSRLSQQE